MVLLPDFRQQVAQPHLRDSGSLRDTDRAAYTDLVVKRQARVLIRIRVHHFFPYCFNWQAPQLLSCHFAFGVGRQTTAAIFGSQTAFDRCTIGALGPVYLARMKR